MKLLFVRLLSHAVTPGGTAASAPLLRACARPFSPPALLLRRLPSALHLHPCPARAPRSLSPPVPFATHRSQLHVLGQPCSTSRRPHPRALHPGAGFPVSHTRDAESLGCGNTTEQHRCSEQYEHSCTAAHMHCRHTCIAAPTGQMHGVLWTCTHTCKSGDGMGTTLKWMLARASGQRDHTPP